MPNLGSYIAKSFYFFGRVRYILAVLFAFICIQRSAAQEISRYPIQFGLYQYSMPTLNPASVLPEYRYTINFGRQGHGSLWRNINTNYFNANFRLNKQLKATESSQILGVSLVSDQEGAFLSQTEASLIYGWHKNLSEKISLGAGISAGLMNYQVKASSISAGGSSITPNIALGVWLYTEKEWLGLSFNQVNRGEIQPIEQIYALEPHLNVTASKIFDINYQFQVQPMVLSRISKDDVNIDITLLAHLQETFSAGASYQLDKGLVVMAGFNKLNIKIGDFKLMCSYRIPFGEEGRQNTQQYEITASVGID